jgi:hypothetical protein
MNRLIRAAATLLAVAATGVTMATTVAASSTVPTIVKPGAHWTVTTKARGCENEHFMAGHKFVADQLGDKGTWSEPTPSTITMTWTGGLNKGTTFKGNFNSGANAYEGKIKFAGVPPAVPANLIPGTHSGC